MDREDARERRRGDQDDLACDDGGSVVHVAAQRGLVILAVHGLHHLATVPRAARDDFRAIGVVLYAYQQFVVHDLSFRLCD